MKYTRLQKAYKIDLTGVEGGYLLAEVSCFADNIKEAKVKLLKEICYEDLKIKDSDFDVTSLNIPVVRYKAADCYDFEGKPMSRREINETIMSRKRIEKLDTMFADPDIEYCFIKKHGQYYGPRHSGYVEDMLSAGIYTKNDAVSAAKSCSDLYIVPIDIDTHNEMINKQITDLQTRLIK